MNLWYIIPVLLLIGLLVLFLTRSNGAPSDPINVSPEASKNPGLFINFTNPDKYGDGSSTFSKFKFYLSANKSDSDNKLENSTVTVGKLPEGVTLSSGDLSLTDSVIKIKFDKSIVSSLEYDGEYWVGVQVFNDKDLSSSVVWSDKSIKYDECKDDPEACWAGGATSAGGSFVYDDTNEEYTQIKNKSMPGGPESGIINITEKSRGPGESWQSWWESLSDAEKSDPSVTLTKCKEACSSKSMNSRYSYDNCLGFNYNPTSKACIFKTISSENNLIDNNNADFYKRNY